MDPDDQPDEFDHYQNVMVELYEEFADYNEAAARSEEDGWFYSDED